MEEDSGCVVGIFTVGKYIVEKEGFLSILKYRKMNLVDQFFLLQYLIILQIQKSR